METSYIFPMERAEFPRAKIILIPSCFSLCKLLVLDAMYLAARRAIQTLEAYVRHRKVGPFGYYSTGPLTSVRLQEVPNLKWTQVRGPYFRLVAMHMPNTSFWADFFWAPGWLVAERFMYGGLPARKKITRARLLSRSHARVTFPFSFNLPAACPSIALLGLS
jgi:hypothetical protein